MKKEELEQEVRKFLKNWKIDSFVGCPDATTKAKKILIDCEKLQHSGLWIIDLFPFSKKRTKEIAYKHFYSSYKCRLFLFDIKTKKFSEVVPDGFKLIRRKNSPQ